jgi:hypothetical protein
VDPSGVLVTKGERQRERHHALVEIVEQVQVGVTRPRTTDAHHHLTGAGFGFGHLSEFGWLLPTSDLKGLHEC